MSVYTKVLIIANILSIIIIAAAAFSIRKKHYTDDSENRANMFEETVTEYAQELSAGQEKEMTCPLCGHTAIIGSSPYNGYIYGQCDCCGTGFIRK